MKRDFKMLLRWPFWWCQLHLAPQSKKSPQQTYESTVACGVLLLSTILTRKLGLAAKPLFEFGYPRYVVFGLDTNIGHQQIIHCAGMCPVYKSWMAAFTTDREFMAAGRSLLFD